MRTIIWFIYFWGALVALLPRLRRAQKAQAAGDTAQRDKIVDEAVGRWCRRLLKMAGMEITVEGRENLPDTPVVFVANHQGYFDIPLLLTCLDKPHGIVSKQGINKLPLVRDWMVLLGCVFIDRDNARQAVTALGDAAKALTQEGRSFIIFPEGTRSKGGPVGEFKNGGFRIAFKTGAPILPVCIDGTWRAMEANHYFIKPCKVRLTILPAIPTQNMTKEETKLVAEQVREAISAQINQKSNNIT